MRKIEEYKKARALAENMREFADGVNPDQPHDSRRYKDKLGMEITIGRTWAGSYGDSSTYSWSDYIKGQVEKEIGLSLRSIIAKAASRLESEAEEKRVLAQDEAREVQSQMLA